MVRTNAEADIALSKATKEANEGLIQLRSNFALAKQMFQKQLMQDLEAASTKTQTFFERLLTSMDTAVSTTMSKMSSRVKDIELDTESLSEVIIKLE